MTVMRIMTCNTDGYFYYLYFFFFLVFLLEFFPTTSSSSSELIINSTSKLHHGYTAISDFRLVNRRKLINCPGINQNIKINVVGYTNNSGALLSNEENVTVTVSGISSPSKWDWIAMVSPAHSDVSYCPLNLILYKQTGDLSTLPLLCHYPIKAQYMREDPSYLSCKNSQCHHYNRKGVCARKSCSGTLAFHVVNIRTDIEFVLFAGGLDAPCILKKSPTPIKFANPNSPLYGHLSSIDSTGTSMRLTWVSGDREPQQIQYGNGKSKTTSLVTTFTQKDMCTSVLPSPAKDFGWHDPGYIHSAVMTGLQPSQAYSYRYGSDSVGWSNDTQFRTPPAGGTDELKFLAFGDMGKAPLDASVEHYIQPGALSVIEAVKEEVASRNIDSVFHIGDISYATGFLVEWDYFLNLITPIASHVSYMTAIGNHERDYINTGSVYITPDSGGECGVAYEKYFPMPTSGKDKPWYSIEQASVHFTVISTENDWSNKSEQYEWMEKDLKSVNRSRTPWLIFTGHRPMYSSVNGLLPSVDSKFVHAVEPLLVNNKVDLVLWGHVHNYERTCSIYKNTCKAMPTKDRNGIDTYDHNNYTAPVHAVIGMAGFTLDKFNANNSWSLSRISEFGYMRGHATTDELRLEVSVLSGALYKFKDFRLIGWWSITFVNSKTKKVEDSFYITKNS